MTDEQIKKRFADMEALQEAVAWGERQQRIDDTIARRLGESIAENGRMRAEIERLRAAKRIIEGLLYYADGHEVTGKLAKEELSSLRRDAEKFLAPICVYTGEPCDRGCDEDSACMARAG